MCTARLIASTFVAVTALAQRQPDLAAQREAMKELAFLAGRWEGDATVSHGAGAPIRVRQSEDVQWKLDGLLMLIEGTGRNLETGAVVFNALATVAYDDAAGQYRLRSFNDGRYLDTELKVPPRASSGAFRPGPRRCATL